jgi:ribosome maturation factor RimP
MGVESTSGRAQRGRGSARGDSPRRNNDGPQRPRAPRASQEAIRAVVEPVVAAAGFDLEDLRVEPAGRRRLVRVIVDADGGVSLDDVAIVSQGVSQVLDETDLMGSAAYALEVSSPGVDRPLTEPRHWRRAKGRLVRVGLSDGGEITGRVLGADEAAVEIEVGGERHSYGFGEVGRGRVQVEFHRDEVGPGGVMSSADEDEGGAS